MPFISPEGPFPDPLSRIVFHEIFDAFWTFAIILCCGILVSNEISRRKARSDLKRLITILKSVQTSCDIPISTWRPS